MPRSPEDNLLIRENRRKAIVEAAVTVFADKGFARARIADIATEAQLSHGLVYHYFRSKKAIFIAILEEMMARTDADMALEAGSAFERICVAIQRHEARQHERIDTHRVVTAALVQGTMPEEVRLRLREHVASIHERLAGWIDEAQRDGDVDDRVPATELASAVLCLFRGMSLRLPPGAPLPFPPPSVDTIIHLLRPRLAGEARAPS